MEINEIEDIYNNPYALEWLEAFKQGAWEYELSGYDQLNSETNAAKFKHKG